MPETFNILDLPLLPNSRITTAALLGGKVLASSVHDSMVTVGAGGDGDVDLGIRIAGPQGLEVIHNVAMSAELARGLLAGLEGVLNFLGEREGKQRVQIIRTEGG